MKKILLVFEGSFFSKGVLDCALSLHQVVPAMLTALFISNVHYSNLWSYQTGMAGPTILPEEPEADTSLQWNRENFEAFCIHHNIAHAVHQHGDFSLSGIQKESRFADLAIIGSETFFSHLVGVRPDRYLEETLHHLECPSLIVPEDFKYPERTVIAYDGSPNSVFAIKQFAYLFPQWADHETLMVFSDEREDKPMPDEALAKELAMQHFPDLRFTRLLGGASKKFSGWAAGHGRAVLVCGAYGRSSFSNIFRSSFAKEVITEHKLPVFIAHV